MIYHLKPIGTKSHPVREDETFEVEERFDFKIKPKKIYRGDKLIVFGVGSSRIISIYQVLSDFPIFSQGREYPYSLQCRDLFPIFSANWYKNNLRWTELEREFKKSHPTKTLRVDSNTLRGIQFGLSSLSVSKEFGKFVETSIVDLMTIEKIKEYSLQELKKTINLKNKI